MNILRRGVSVKETRNDEKSGEEITQGRIEVTVEREWVSMLVRGQPKEGAKQPASADSGSESGAPELPAPSSAAQDPAARDAAQEKDRR
jgi:hypothetical protein